MLGGFLLGKGGAGRERVGGLSKREPGGYGAVAGAEVRAFCPLGAGDIDEGGNQLVPRGQARREEGHG